MISIDEINKYEREATVYYFLWFFTYAVLGLWTVVLPGLAAMGIDLGFSNGAKYLAGMGSLAAAAFGFFKPHDYVTAFDAAIAELRSLRVRLDLLTPEQNAERLDKVFHLMAFKYPGALAVDLKRRENTQRDKPEGREE